MSRIVGIAGVVLGLGIATTLPAVGLTCALFPEDTPEAVVANRLALPSSDTRVYDLAVVGTVRRITTDERDGSPTPGRTEIDFEVAGVFGDTTTPETFVVTASDPGWMSGYSFVEGQGYFVPVLLRGPRGEPNYSFACDPITVVGDPAVTAMELAAIAGEVGLEYGLPAEAGAASPGPGTTMALTLFAALILWTLLRSRRHRPRPGPSTDRPEVTARGSDPRRPRSPRR